MHFLTWMKRAIVQWLWTMSERIAEHRGEKRLADGQRGRISSREKLAEMCEKIASDKAQIVMNKHEVTKTNEKGEAFLRECILQYIV